MRLLSVAGLVVCAALVGFGARAADVLNAVGGVPAHLAGMFEEPLAFQRLSSGEYLVFDRRAHAVYLLDAQRTTARKIIDIGPEAGRLLGPTAVASGPGDIFVVADAPNRVERLQFFNLKGEKVGGFTLPGRASLRVTLGSLVLSGVGSLQFTGRSVLLNQPETSALVTEYGLAGTPVRTFGALRHTGHEDDRDLHLALNVGVPVVNPRGGYYFVFQTGEPRIRRYDAAGAMLWERLLQGREIDALLGAQPTTWIRRDMGGEQLPLVPPIVRAAAADRHGNIWVSLLVPFTHVYDEDGELLRRVQFRAAGITAPSSLSFTGEGRLLITPGLYEFRPD